MVFPYVFPFTFPQPAKPYLYYLVGTMNIAPGLPPSWLQSWESVTNPFLDAAITAIYNVVTVPYPATLFDAGTSYYTGIDMTVAQINAHSGPFALGGASQGAGVISQVLKMLQAGDGNIDGNRLGDLIFGVTYGNPARQAGKVAPGTTDPGGHGIRLPQFRLTDTPDNWWDFSQSGDIISCNGDDPISELATAVFEYFWNDANIDTSTATMTQIYSEITTASQQLEAASTWTPAEVQAVVASEWAALTWTGVHDNYQNWQPISGNSSTAIQLAKQQLITVANAAGYGSVGSTVGPVISGVPAQSLMGSISSTLNVMGNQHMMDARFAAAATVLGGVASNWKSNPTQAALSLNTFMSKLGALISTYPTDGRLANALSAAQQLAGTYAGSAIY
jgi:hypothetical protein